MAFEWLKRLFRASERKTSVVVELSRDDADLLAWWAGSIGLTLDDYLVRTGVSAVPQRERLRFETRHQQAAVVEAAFEDSDREDGYVKGVFPMPELSMQAVVAEDPAEREKPPNSKLYPGHPCVYLTTEPPSLVYTRALPVLSGSGTCWRSVQRGKPCYWAPVAAKECPLFEERLKKT